jgi:hypothetical protein
LYSIAHVGRLLRIHHAAGFAHHPFGFERAVDIEIAADDVCTVRCKEHGGCAALAACRTRDKRRFADEAPEIVSAGILHGRNIIVVFAASPVMRGGETPPS